MLRVTEIFASIQGETTHQGVPWSFIRLTGCNLRCRYCDTTYAYDGGHELSRAEIVSRVMRFGIPRVTVTGGEPLLQPATPALVEELLDRGCDVFVETNGTLPLSGLDRRAVRIMDVKCPGSGESPRMLWENFSCLTPRDEVKFVIASREDYVYAREVVARHRPAAGFPVLFSPAFGILPPDRLAGWMIDDRLDARLQIQIHKLVFGPDRRGV